MKGYSSKKERVTIHQQNLHRLQGKDIWINSRSLTDCQEILAMGPKNIISHPIEYWITKWSKSKSKIKMFQTIKSYQILYCRNSRKISYSRLQWWKLLWSWPLQWQLPCKWSIISNKKLKGNGIRIPLWPRILIVKHLTTSTGSFWLNTKIMMRKPSTRRKKIFISSSRLSLMIFRRRTSMKKIIKLSSSSAS